MGMSALPWFHRFSSSRRSPCSLSSQDFCAFYSFLSEHLEKLGHSLVEDSVSLRWSVEAMNLLKKMQIELLALFKKAKLPISFGAEEDWFNQYMQETVTLLDFCNSLKSAVSGINRYRMVVDLATQKILENQSSSMASLDDLDFGELPEEHENFVGVRMMKETNSVCSEIVFASSNKNDESIDAVMLAARSTMIVVSLLLVSAIISPLSINMGSEDLISAFPQLKPFTDILTALVARFHETASKQENGSKSVLIEHVKIDSAVGSLKAQAAQGVVGEEERERFLRSADLLRTTSAELREGIEMFDRVVDEVFDVVIKGRKEMLAVFRNGALAMG